MGSGGKGKGKGQGLVGHSVCRQSPQVPWRTLKLLTARQKEASCMVLYSLSVEGLIEGNMKDNWFCLFFPYVQSKSALAVDE